MHQQSHNINKNPNYYLLNLFHKPFPSIKFKNTLPKEIEKIINSLKIKESSGYDEVSAKILKISVPFISSPLIYICNKSMLSGTSPTRLKCAIVKRLLKKGDKKNVANYRPISLLTSLSKVFERIISFILHPSSFYYIPLYHTDMEQVSNIMQCIKHIVITYINNHED